MSRIADSEESVMLMLGRCLPHIVPNVLLAKREVNLLVLVILPSSSPPCFPIHCHHHRLLVLITNRYTQSSKDENRLKKVVGHSQLLKFPLNCVFIM